MSYSSAKPWKMRSRKPRYLKRNNRGTILHSFQVVRLLGNRSVYHVPVEDFVRVSQLYKQQQASGNMMMTADLHLYSDQSIIAFVNFIQNREIKSALTYHAIAELVQLAHTFQMKDLKFCLEDVRFWDICQFLVAEISFFSVWSKQPSLRKQISSRHCSSVTWHMSTLILRNLSKILQLKQSTNWSLFRISTKFHSINCFKFYRVVNCQSLMKCLWPMSSYCGWTDRIMWIHSHLLCCLVWVFSSVHRRWCSFTKKTIFLIFLLSLYMSVCYSVERVGMDSIKSYFFILSLNIL